MSDVADETYRLKLVADASQHDPVVERSASVWERAAQRMSRSSSGVASSTSADGRRAASSWDSAAARMGGAARRLGSDNDAAARRTGAAWDAAAQRWRGSSGQFVSGANAASGALGGLGSRAAGSSGGMRSGASSAAFFAAKLFLIVGAAGAAGAALSAIPALIGALGGAVAVGAFAFGGIGAALQGYAADQKAGAAASNAGASAAKSSARAIRDAYKQIANAQRQQARTARDGAEAVEAAAERVEAAKRAEVRAYRAVGDAQRQAQKAEEDLNRARAESVKRLDELQERVSDLALDQEGAAIAVAEAEKAYYRELRSSESTELSRRKALYDLNVAKERQSDLERESTEAVQENNEAQAKGVEGSDAVVEAKERLADAQRAVSDAQEAAAESTQDRERAERDAGRAARDAAEANEDAARAVADAMESLSDAQEQAGEAAAGAAGGVSQFDEAMKKLGPRGKELVRQLISMKPLFERLNRVAEDAFLPGVISMLKKSEVLFPIFERGIHAIGTAMGGVADRFGDLFQNSQFQANLEKMMMNAVPVVTALGDGLIAIVDAFVRLGANTAISEGLAGLITGISDGIVALLDVFNANGDTFGNALQRWGDLFAWLLPLAGNLLAWAASIDPAIWLVAAAVAGLIGVAGTIGPAFTGIRDAFDLVGGSARRNRDDVRNLDDSLGDLQSGRRRNGGGSSGGGTRGGGTGNGSRTGNGAGGAGGTGTGNGAGGNGTGNGGADGPDGPDGANGGGRRGGGRFGAIASSAYDEIGGLAGGIAIGSEIMGGVQNGGDGDWWGGAGMADDIGGWLAGLGTQLTQLGPKIEAGKQQVASFWDTAQAKLGLLPGGAQTWFGGLMTTAADNLGLTSLIAGEQAGKTAGSLRTGLAPIPGEGANTFRGLTTGASAQGEGLVDWARNAPGRILRFFQGFSLFNSGVSLVSGWWDGIAARWNQMVNWVRQGMANLRALWPFSPAKTGPFSGSGYVTHSGRALTGDFAQSLRDGTPGIIASARAAMEATQAAMGADSLGRLALPDSLPTAGLAVEAAIGSAGGGTTVIHKSDYHIAGTVVAERELLNLVRVGTNRHAGRNTSNGLSGG